MNPQESLQYLTGRLRRLKSFILLHSLSTGLAMLLTALAVLLLLGWLFNLAFWLSPTFRIIFVILAGAWLLGLLVTRILTRVVKQPSTEDVALQVEKRYPELKNHLIASLQLEKNLTENREGFSTDLIRAVIGRSKSLCGDLDFKQSVNRSPLRKWSRNLAVAVVVVALIAVLFPGSFGESVYLYSHPRLEIERDLTYQLEVTPENAELAKFASLEIGARVFGTGLPEKALLYWRYPGGKVKRIELKGNGDRAAYTANLPTKLSAVDTLAFTYNFREVRRSFEYWVTSGEIETPPYRIIVVDKPRVVGLKLTYTYPAYTGLEPLVVDENDGNISAIKGTTVAVETSLNKPVLKGQFAFANGQAEALESSGHRLRGNIRVMENGSYHIEVIDSLGHANEKPIEYRIEKLADLYPEVDIFAPGVPVDLDDRMALDLGVQLLDDFGFSQINLIYRVFSPQGETFEVKTPIPFKRSQGREFELIYAWDLADIGLEPGGFVEYLIEAYDNDNISGPKRGLSQTLTARLPSLDEMFAYLEDEGEEQISTLEQLRQQQQELAEDMEDLQQELLTNQEMDWEDRKDIEQSLQNQQDIMQAMEDVAERMQQMEEEMRQNDLTSLEILQKLQELKKLFEEVATPEMKEAMRKMQEALQNMDPQELKDAAEDMQMSQEELKERLERSIALLKLLQIQQKMENLTRMLEQIIDKQEQVNQATERSAADSLPKLAPSEQRNKDEFDNLKEEVEELKKLLADAQLDQDPTAQSFCQAPSESDADDQMQEMVNQMKQADKGKSEQKGEAALSSLQELLKKMNEEKESFNQKMGMQSADKMKDAVDDLLYVSDQQESVFDQAEKAGPRSPELRNLASEQQAIERTMEALRQKLTEIAKESAFYDQQISDLVDQARQCMGNATSNLTSRNGSAAMRHQKDAMFSLNNAANQLLQSMQSQKMCSSGSCSNENMFKKMKKLSKQQQQINKQSSSQCQNPNKQGEGKSAMQRLASQQQAVQKSLDQMQQEQGNRREILGRLDELAREARRVVEDLEDGSLDENTLERQNKIHSRMLDFQRSLERQDFKEERQAERGLDVPRTSPDRLRFDDASSRNTYQDRLQKYLKEKYPEEYEELVKEYFRAVNSRQNGQ